MKKLDSLLFGRKSQVRKHTWVRWHSSCNHPSTMSFRLRGDEDDDMFKTVNSVYLDTTDDSTPDQSRCFFTSTNSCESTSASQECSDDEESLDTVISRVVKSDRLFFKPDQTNYILDGVDPLTDNGDEDQQVPFKESVALAMESENPYADFRRSMEAIVECHGLREWGHLEGLLKWYLEVNGKDNHKYIIGAFVDMLVSISPKNNVRDAMSTYSSALSSISSPSSLSVCSCVPEHGIQEADK